MSKENSISRETESRQTEEAPQKSSAPSEPTSPVPFKESALKRLARSRLGRVTMLVLLLGGAVKAIDVYDPTFFPNLLNRDKQTTLELPPGVNVFLAQKSRQDLPVFIRNSLQSSLIPPDFTIRPIIDAKGVLRDPNRFTSSWNLSSGIIIHTSLRYNEEGQIEDKDILIILPQTLEDLTVTSSTTIDSQYFSQKTSGSFKCATVDLKDRASTNATLCENFQVDTQQVKRGVGVMSPIPGTAKSSVFLCELYPRSPIYSWKSCSIYKAETGWK